MIDCVLYKKLIIVIKIIIHFDLVYVCLLLAAHNPKKYIQIIQFIFAVSRIII
jgi:hypothetical protein